MENIFTMPKANRHQQKTIVFLTIIVVLLLGCDGRKQWHGVNFYTLQSGELLIQIETNTAILVEQSNDSYNTLLIANLGDSLSFKQLTQENPIGNLSVDFHTKNRTHISTMFNTSQGWVTILDIDGNGIPDYKILDDNNSQSYRYFYLKNIEWAEKTKNHSETRPPGTSLLSEE